MTVSKIVISYTINSTIADMRNNPVKTAVFALSAIPLFELVIRSIGNLHDMATLKQNSELRDRTGKALIGVVLLMPCAFDAFPEARLCGAIGFIFYSVHTGNHPHTLISSEIIHAICTRVLPGALGLIKLFLRGIDYIRQNKIKTVVVLVSAYLIYKESNISYRRTVSKTRTMLSRVWRRV